MDSLMPTGSGIENLPAWCERFLRRLAETSRIGEAAEHAGVSQETVRRWRRDKPDFALACKEAEGLYREKIRREIERRGMEGWEEPIYQAGARVLEPALDENGHVMHDEEGRVILRPAVVRKFSDSLLLALAKRHDSEFRERVDVSAGLPSEEAQAVASSASVRAFLETFGDEERAALRLLIAARERASSTSSAPEIPASTSNGPVGTRPPVVEDADVVEPV